MKNRRRNQFSQILQAAEPTGGVGAPEPRLPGVVGRRAEGPSFGRLGDASRVADTRARVGFPTPPHRRLVLAQRAGVVSSAARVLHYLYAVLV